MNELVRQQRQKRYDIRLLDHLGASRPLSAIDTEKPAWQANFFTGMPAPAGALSALLPLYLQQIFAFAPDSPPPVPGPCWSASSSTR